MRQQNTCLPCDRQGGGGNLESFYDDSDVRPLTVTTGTSGYANSATLVFFFFWSER